MMFRVASGAAGPYSRRQPGAPLSRRLLAAITGAGWLAASTASLAANPCGMSPARQAFDVEGLKSELMVTALSCNSQDRYNAFIEKFRPELLAQERTLTAYFATSYGRAAQKEHDDYITQLANVQSERGLQAGTSFCDQRVSMFNEVAVLDNARDLGGYAEAKDIVQPAIYETCSAPTPARGGSRVRHIRGTRVRTASIATE